MIHKYHLINKNQGLLDINSHKYLSCYQQTFQIDSMLINKFECQNLQMNSNTIQHKGFLLDQQKGLSIQRHKVFLMQMCLMDILAYITRVHFHHYGHSKVQGKYRHIDVKVERQTFPLYIFFRIYY